MTQDWRAALWARFREVAEERGADEVRFPVYFAQRKDMRLEVALVGDELRARVTSAEIAMLDKLEAEGVADRFREGKYRNIWVGATALLREGLGRTVSLNVFATALWVPMAYPNRTSPTIGVYGACFVKPKELKHLLDPDELATASKRVRKKTGMLHIKALGEALLADTGDPERGGDPADAADEEDEEGVVAAAEPADEEEEQEDVEAQQADEVWTDHHNVIFFGPPGTGKSYRLQNIARSHLGASEDRLIRITFHPETSYFDFVGSFRPAVGWRRSGNEFEDADGQRQHREPLSYYRFEPGPFSEALAMADDDPQSTVVLAIEELNRGNVAAIFGDVFQLLDRKRSADRALHGWSEYGIRPSSEWSIWLQSRCQNKHVFHQGRLRLPPNLYLYATMNTSDQSLFPMDTAFRRRWGLQYVGMEDKGNQARVPMHSRDASGVPWLSLMQTLNDRIVDHTRSDDKQVGPWFVRARPRQPLVDSVEFSSKVLFYLWSEVFRDRPERAFQPQVTTYDALVNAYRSGRHVFCDEILDALGVNR